MLKRLRSPFRVDIDRDARGEFLHLACLAQYAAAEIARACDASFNHSGAFEMLQVIHDRSLFPVEAVRNRNTMFRLSRSD
ncbi:hypothetical protein ACGK9R_10910 [Halomonas sp. HNIBRBA4712]|uniref:hypothetical protein n=1 Tax=Halomonas sp. HNIBRBA4712 TaxID=3373087 RepID=UPI003744EFCF